MGSVNVGILHKRVAQLCSGKLDEWVCASVGSIYSTGGSYTYMGCSKAVYGPSSSQNWLCRKKLSMYDTFPDECLNHGYKHDGNCCALDEGIMCYRFSIRLVDQSGELEALIWAPAIHLLSVPPEEFDAMTTAQQEEIFQGLQGKEWRFNILTVVDELGFRQFKVQFLLPTEKSYVLKSQAQPFGEMLQDLPRMASLTLPTYPRNGGDQGRPVGILKGPQRNNETVESEVVPLTIERGIFAPMQNEVPSPAVLAHLRTSLESLVAASQQNTRAIEQLALALREIQKGS
ncbi:unnamed protein product [Calypogeia fissa]